MNSILVLTVAVTLLYLTYCDGNPLMLPGDNDLKGLMNMSPEYSDDVPCGFNDLNSKYSLSCKNNYLMDILQWSAEDNMVTGNQLLEQLATVCSSYSSYRKCVKCFARSDCPEQSDLAYETLMKKWSIFCDKDLVSEWLQAILENGFRFNHTCHRTLYRCYDLAYSEFPYNRTFNQQMSLLEGISRQKSRFSSIFKCLIGEYLAINEDLRNECGSSWQDVILAERLRSSTFPGIGYNLDRNQIQMLQDIRC